MKLYAWQPRGHGELSFFVMAETEEDARREVEARLPTLKETDYEGWGTDYYELIVAEPGQVITHCND